MEMDGEIFDKPGSLAAAKSRLQNMRGRAHRLINATVCLQPNTRPWVHFESATLHVRSFSDDWLDDYMASEGDDLCHCVGGYMYEKRGAQLFDKVEGDYYSILGLPLLPLLSYLRGAGAIKA